MKLRRPMMAGAAAIALVGAALLGNGLAASQAADAAPMNCAGPDAPPACHHASPPPTAPPVLQILPIAPIANVPNDFWVQVDVVSPSSVAEYADGSDTRFAMVVSCSNGFHRIGPMMVRRTSDGRTSLFWKTRANAGQAAGSCFATTWDQAILGVSHTTYFVSINPPSDPNAAGWSIYFGSTDWRPSPNYN